MLSKSILTLASVSSVLAAPASTWLTLTPSATIKGAATDYDGTFGIAVIPITSSVSTVLAKRDAVSQISDGQIQASTATPSTTKKSTAQAISQITDGQIQASTSTSKPKSTAQAISQISDGQIQATTTTAKAKSTAQAISQISDGQIQATTLTTKAKSTAQAISQISDGQIQASTTTTKAKATAQAVSQIGDGQIQASTATKSTAQAISQISDGQIQATTSTAKAVSQISDGQIQATTSTAKTTSAASQISDGQVQASSTASSVGAASTDDADTVACRVDGTLQLTLKSGVLKDSAGRIGSIVANRQFQFDGPPPQAGAIYAAGWSIDDGNLAIGNTTIFYQCLSGNFYNLYDESLGAQCKPVYLEITGLVDC